MKLPVNLLKEVSSQKSLRNRNSSSELVSFWYLVISKLKIKRKQEEKNYNS
jgi:hypothetical protein